MLGRLPHGLPAFKIPLIRLDDLEAVITGDIAVALVSFAATSVLSRTYAALAHTDRSNQEMVSLGAASSRPAAAGPDRQRSSRTPVPRQPARGHN